MKQTTGKSMIEMIGVLAIIGVMSIGGVWGVRKAFIKNTVNNLIEDVRLAGFIVVDEMFTSMQQMDNTEQDVTSLEGKFTPKTTYPFTAFKESEVTFAVVASKVSEAICKETITRKVDWLEEIRPNGLDNECKEGDENTISFFFNTQLNTQEQEFLGACKEDADCGECGTCNGRKCVYDSNKPVKVGNVCKACPTTLHQYATAASCRQCKDAFWAEGSGNKVCYNCASNVSTAIISKEDCLRCNQAGYNKYWQGTDENSLGSCRNCEGIVTKNGTYCDWECMDGFVATQGYTKCIDCETAFSTRYMYNSRLKDCRKCDNRFFIGTNPEQGLCSPCSDNSTGQYVFQEDCLKCNQSGFNKFWTNPNSQGFGECRNCVGTLVKNNSLCDWECEAGTYGGGSACNACNDTARMSYSSLRTCRNCENMYYSGKEEIGGLCNGCKLQYTYSDVRKADCLRCGNRTWNGTYVDENSRGTCALCNGTVSADGTQCITE